MNKQNLKGYESPTTEIVELRIDGSILTVSASNMIILDAVVQDSWGDL